MMLKFPMLFLYILLTMLHYLYQQKTMVSSDLTMEYMVELTTKMKSTLTLYMSMEIVQVKLNLITP